MHHCSQAVVANGQIIFLRGQVSQDLETREVLQVGDPTAQTRKTMENIKLLLEGAGSSLGHICRTVVYLTDIRYRDAVYQEMGRLLQGAPGGCSPARPGSWCRRLPGRNGSRNRGDRGHSQGCLNPESPWSAAMCSGWMPQQPPTTWAPAATHSRAASTNSAGVVASPFCQRRSSA